LSLSFFFLLLPLPPSPTLFPYTTLFRSWTAPATVERARGVMENIGQVPIVVKRELDGFILNRLQGALLSEALRLVGEGYVSPQRSEEHTSELQSRFDLVCRLLLEKKKKR